MSKISRDPFARTELHANREYTFHTCQWCGQVKQTRNGRKYLYRYEVQSDGGRVSQLRGLFCSVGCMRAFNM